MKEICDCSSDSFSWRQSEQELQRHQWGITQRRKQLLDENHLEYYRFRSGRGCDWILLSCDASKVDSRERLRGLLVWQSQHPDATGQIHFGDAAQDDAPWIASLASSLRLELPTETPAIYIGARTDNEILSMIDIDPRQSESN